MIFFNLSKKCILPFRILCRLSELCHNRRSDVFSAHGSGMSDHAFYKDTSLRRTKMKKAISVLSALLFYVFFPLCFRSIAWAEGITIDEAHFPDVSFRSFVSEHCDIDTDNSLSDAELASVTIIDCSGSYNNRNNIASLEGIEYFVMLQSLTCSYNQLNSIDISFNINLQELDCSNNQLASLNVTDNLELERLFCGFNRLTNLNVQNNEKLKLLSCQYNNLVSLDVSNNLNLEQLWFSGNQLESIDISNNSQLFDLSCESNLLKSLDTSNNELL